MMNPKLRFTTNRDRFICWLDLTEFLFDPSDKASRNAALAKLDQHGTQVLATLEEKAGRPLSNHELLHGVSHVDDRTREERVAAFTAMKQERRTDVRKNPYQAALDAGQVDPPKKETRREMYERCSEEWEEKKRAEAEQRAKEADPVRRKAVKHAEQEIAVMRYDTSVTLREIEMAKSRLDEARNGDLEVYGKLDREWRAKKQAKIDELAAGVNQQIEALRERKAEIESGAFQLPSLGSDSTSATL